MNKRYIRPLILVGLFVVFALIFEILTNDIEIEETKEMSDATFPVVEFSEDGSTLNQLFGYKNKMDIPAVRDGITPIEKSGKLSSTIKADETKVKQIEYQVTTLDGKKPISKIKKEVVGKDGTFNFDMELGKLKTNKEYALTMKVETEDIPIYYYTRVIRTKGLSETECLKFAKEFHDYTFKKEEASSFLPKYMDPTKNSSQSLAHVNLSNSINYLTWDSLEPEIVTEPVYTFSEINESYNIIVSNYIIKAKNEAGAEEYYNVEEYYRLRYSATRMYVIDFERNMDQIFSSDNQFIANDSQIRLGIRDDNVNYKVSEAGGVIAFVQQGDLWCYSVNKNEISKVFSFKKDGKIDPRCNNNQHGIIIINVDEAGSIDFLVDGYMNRGDHEGEVGIAEYHYDGLANTVKEEAFIQMNKSYEVVEAELGTFAYENNQNELYIENNGNLQQINLSTLKSEKIVSGLRDGGFMTSANSKYFVWTDKDKINSSTKIHVRNLEKNKKVDIKAKAGTYIKPVGFIGNDLVYGIANQSDVSVDGAGNVNFPMTSFKIVSFKNGKIKVLKDYTPSGAYVSGISIDDYTINVTLSNGTTDSIMNREADANTLASISYTTTEKKKTQICISFKNKMSKNELKKFVPKLVDSSEDNEICLSKKNENKQYTVYAKGHVTLVTGNLSEAINNANDLNGVVIGDDGNYV